MHKRPAKTRQQKEEAVAEEEQEEAEEEEGVEEEAEQEEEEAEEEEEEAQEEGEEAEEEEEEAEEGEEGEEEEEEGHEVAEEGDKGEEEEGEEGAEQAEEEVQGTATSRQLRITKAMNRTYIQEKDYEGVWRLIVEVSDKATQNHREVIQAIYNAMMQDMAVGKEQALAMKLDILHWP